MIKLENLKIEDIKDFFDNLTDEWSDLYDGANPPNLEKFGLEYLGLGSGRMVYKSNEYVIKFAISDNGELQSEMERKISSEISHPMLCKTVYTQYEVNVMPYASNSHDINVIDDIYDVFKKEYNSEELLKQLEELLNILVNKYNIYKEDIIKVTSWGKIGNQFVLYDYGCTVDLYNKCF